MTLSLNDVLEDPARVGRVLQDELFGVTVDQYPSNLGTAAWSST